MTATMDYRDTFVDHITPTPEITTNVGTMTGSHKAQIGKEALGLVMTMLSDAYSDPIEAVTREIVANGIDAHAVVSNRSPVRISAPTQASPMFTVVDSGVGMTRSQLKENFADYGNSLKAGERITIGRFGIGAKSPYAVTSQFTVTTTHRGRTVVALFFIGSDGSPEHRVITDELTTDPDGTTVSIPVEPEKVEQWRSRIRTVMSYVDHGLVEIAAGDLPIQEDDHVTNRVSPRLSTSEVGFLTDLQYEQRNVVMGNIGYSLPGQMSRDFPRRLVFFAPPSSLELTHTRETIKDTPHNRGVLEAMIERWHATVFADLLVDLSAATTQLDRLIARQNYLQGARREQNLNQQHNEHYLLSELGKHSPLPDIGMDHLVHHERNSTAFVEYRPDEKRDSQTSLSLRSLVPFAVGEPDFLLVDVEPENWLLSDQATLRKVTAAVACAREDATELTVRLMSRAHLEEIVDNETREGQLLPLDASALPWVRLEDFLEANRSVRARAGGAPRGSFRAYFEQFDPAGDVPLYASTVEESRLIEPAQMDGLLALTSSRTIVICDKPGYEQVEKLIDAGRKHRDFVASAERFCSLLHDAVFVRSSNRSVSRMAQAHDAKVVTIVEHVRTCLTTAVSRSTRAEKREMAKYSSTMLSRQDQYRRMADDPRLPKKIRNAVDTRILKGHRYHLTPEEKRALQWIHAVGSRTDLGQGSSEDTVAQLYPLLAELYRTTKNHRISDDLLAVVVAAQQEQNRR